MTRFLHLFILLSPATVCLVWLAESGRLRRAFIETASALRGLSRGRAAALAVLVLWATISGGDKQMSPLPPTAPESAGAEMQGEAVPETPLLTEPEGAGWPWAMPLWPFDAVVSNAVAGLSATNVPPIPDAMLESGLALYRAAAGVALEPRAPGAVPAYAWDHHAADNRGLEFTLPFAFPLGTNAYNRAGVLSNGRLSFGFHTLHRRTPGGLPFATPYPVVTLAPLWGPYGLLPSAGSGVWAQGDSNRFTVCWQDMLLHGDTNLPATAECDLLPGGAVRFRYGGIPGGAATNSTVGVQNLGPGWSFGGAAAPVFAGLELALRPVAAAGWADADPDGDGLTNFEEFMIGTDERLADTDGDGPSDSWEPAHGFDPLTPQLTDPDPDNDNDGVPDRWAGWMGDHLGDATNYYTLASLCADSDGDGFTGWYELFALGSNPNQAASPGAAPEGFVDMVAVVTSSLPCVLRLTGEAGSVEIPWMPGLSPERIRLRLEVGKTYQAELSRVPDGTAFPASGFWWAGLISFEVPDFENQPPVVMEGVTIYWGGKVRVTTPDRAGDLWQTPGEAEIPPAAVEVWTVNVDGPHVFCHSSGYAEVTVLTNSLYSGGIVWSSIPDGIEGDDNPLVIDPGEIPPGSYTVYAVSEENPAVTGETTVVISHLSLTETTIYVGYGDTNVTSLGISGDTYPQADITVTSDPPGISNLSFRASDLEPGTYTVTVDNGSCAEQQMTVTVVSISIVGFSREVIQARHPQCYVACHMSTCLVATVPSDIAVEYSIAGTTNYGCTIADTTGVLTPGVAQSGPIVLRVALQANPGVYAETNIVITAIPTAWASCTLVYTNLPIYYGGSWLHTFTSSGGSLDREEIREVVSIVPPDVFGFGNSMDVDLFGSPRWHLNADGTMDQPDFYLSVRAYINVQDFSSLPQSGTHNQWYYWNCSNCFDFFCISGPEAITVTLRETWPGVLDTFTVDTSAYGESIENTYTGP